MKLGTLLSGQALDTFYGLPNNEQKDYDKVKDALMRHYLLTEEGFRKELFTTKPKSTETPQQFMSRLERLFENWIQASKTEKSYEKLKNLILKEEFYKRCHTHMVSHLRDRAETDITVLASTAQHYIDSYGGNMKDPKDKAGATYTTTDQFCKFCNKRGHTVSNCWFQNQQDGIKKCFCCGSSEHFVKECTNTYKKEIGSAVIAYTSLDKKSVNNPVQKYRNDDTEAISEWLNVPVSEGKVNGKEVFVMRDSGFSFAAVREEFVEPEQLLNEYEDLLLMDSTIRRFQKARIRVETEYYIGELDVLVVNNPIIDLVFGNVKDMRVGKTDTQQENEQPESKEPVHNCYSEQFQGTAYDLTETRKQERADENSNPRPKENQIGYSEITPERKTECEEVITNHSQKNMQNISDIQTITSSAAAVTGSQAKKSNVCKPLIVPEPEIVDRETFKEFQKEDEPLERYWKMVNDKPKEKRNGDVGYVDKAGLLHRVFTPKRKGNSVKQLMVPEKLISLVLSVAHDGLLSGHSGVKRTRERVMSNFYWKDVASDVKRYCRSCEVCQKTAPKGRQGKAPLQRMPIMKEPFQRVAVDLVFPTVPCSETGHRYIITVVD